MVISLFTLHLPAASDSKEVKRAIKQMKADVATVKGYLKTEKDQEKNLPKGEALLRKHLADTLFQSDLSLRLLLTDVVKREYEIANEKVYLRQNADTTGLMKTARKMFLVFQELDSIDALPNEKGVQAPSYRKKHAAYLEPYHDNLFKGGVYFFTHTQWDDAWLMLDTYLDCPRQPLFSDTAFDSTNNTYAAYLATLAANHLGDLDRTLKYAEKALEYEPSKESTLTALADLCHAKGDTLHYVDYIERGFSHNPGSHYFFPRIIDHYTGKADYSTAMQFADKALQTDSLNALFLLAKHSLLMSTEQYNEAFLYGKRAIEANDSLPQPHYNVGYILYLRAQESMNQQPKKTYRQRLKEAQAYYRQCLPYMERYRALRPEDRQRWRPVLYDAYLNLNMGKEFSEIENE